MLNFHLLHCYPLKIKKMPDSALTHIKASLKLLKAHYQLILLPLLVVLSGFTINILSNGKLYISSLIATLIMVAIMPVVYGRFNELVLNKEFISWKYLLNKFLLKYLGLILTIAAIMCIPFFFFTLLTMASDPTYFPTIIYVFIIFFYRLVGLYSLPLLFFDNTIKQSLLLGQKCLWGNLQYNLPLLSILVLVSLVSLPFAKSNSEFLNAMFHYIRICISYVINFIVFIAVTLILKNKIYNQQET